MTRIVWTELAESSFDSILDFVLGQWGLKYVHAFFSLTEQVLSNISKHPKIYPFYPKDKNIRKVNIHKTVSLFYSQNEDSQVLTLLLFWGNRQNPLELFGLLIGSD